MQGRGRYWGSGGWVPILTLYKNGGGDQKLFKRTAPIASQIREPGDRTQVWTVGKTQRASAGSRQLWKWDPVVNKNTGGPAPRGSASTRWTPIQTCHKGRAGLAGDANTEGDPQRTAVREQRRRSPSSAVWSSFRSFHQRPCTWPLLPSTQTRGLLVL